MKIEKLRNEMTGEIYIRITGPDKYERRELRFHFGSPNDRDEWTINIKAWDRYCFMVEKHTPG